MSNQQEDKLGCQLFCFIIFIIGMCLTYCDDCSSDGSLRDVEVQAAVKGYLRENLNDWDSYKSITWSDVEDLDPGYSVVHRYKAKNVFGGYITKTTKFYVDENGVVRYTEDY